MILFHSKPLEKYSSLNQLAVLSLIGINTKYSPSISILFNFNLHPEASKNSKAQFTYSLKDSSIASSPDDYDFCIDNLIRWRLNIASYGSFTNYLDTLSTSRLKKYKQTQNDFNKHGATLSYIEEDWSQYADAVYQLYYNVAKRHGAQLYDLDFFRAIAKRKEYKLMCIWHQGALIAALVMIDEAPVFHSMVCGLDYNHSKSTRAYSFMHYEIIRLAIDAKKYSVVDIGLTGDRFKAIIGYKPVSSRMEVSARNFFMKHMLQFFSRFVHLNVNAESEIKWNLKFR